MTSINDKQTHEIRTVIKGTKTIDEYNSTKETLVKLAEEAYCKHLNDGEWTHGEPITARFSDRNGNLLVAYNDMTVIEYDSDLNPLKINDGMEIAQNKEKDRRFPFTIVISETLHKKLKTYCKDNDISMTKYIVGLIIDDFTRKGVR